MTVVTIRSTRPNSAMGIVDQSTLQSVELLLTMTA